MDVYNYMLVNDCKRPLGEEQHYFNTKDGLVQGNNKITDTV